jgi:hypothetical protein
MTVLTEYVTIEEAEKRLADVRPLLESARRIKREIECIAAGFDYDTVLLEQEKPRIGALVGQLAQKLEQLEDLGCYVKDLDVGIIDFLSTFEGRDIFLCWKLGESRITHWHEIDEGFAHRQDILDMSQMYIDTEFETPVVENEN